MLSPRLSLTWRVFLGTGAIVTAVLVAALVIASASVRRTGDESARRGLEQAADLVAQFLAGRERSLAGGARVFVQGPYFRALVAERQRDDILDQAFEAAEQLDADWVFITDERGVLLAKSDEPGAAGDQLGAVPLVNGALRGRVTSGFGVSRDTLLFQAVAVPIVIPGGAPVGVLVATKRVDSLLARDVNAATASDVVFYTIAGGRRLAAASTLGRGPDVAAALTALAGTGALAGGAGERPEIRIGGTTYVEQGAALTTAGGDVVGGFLVLRSRDAERTGIADVRRSLFAAGALGLLLALAAAWVTAQRIARPVRALAVAARRAAEGDYAADVGDGATHRVGGDEIDALSAAFRAMLADLRDKQALAALVGAPAAATPASTSAAAHAGPVPLRIAGGAARRAPRDHLAPVPGEVVAGRYAVEAVIGSGGMGVVYRAADLTLGETVGLKMLRPEVVAADPLALERFKDELRLARRLSHRNVVRTHDLGESEGVPFITMEYVDGPSLAAVIRAHGPLPLPAVLSVAKQLCRALEVAHEQGIAHGDLKPQNLLLEPDGALKVTDFGVARLLRRPASHPPTGAARPDLGGAVLGTPEYMAPEQLLGREPDVHTDIYAAGMVLHECLTGATPFQADTPMAFLARKLDAGASTARAPARARPPAGERARGRTPEHDLLARSVSELVARMTAHDPAERPGSAAELCALFARIG